MAVSAQSLKDKPRVLIVKLSSLGDLFHALPAVHCIKVGLDATIDWVVQEEYAGLVNCFADIGRVIPMSRRAFVSSSPGFLHSLRAEKYDLAIDMQGLLKSAMVARLARGRRKIGPSFHREGAWVFYSSVAGDRNKNRHAVEESMDVVRHLRLDALPAQFPVSFPAVPVDTGHPRVGIVPLSRWPTKNWMQDRFAEVARRLQQAQGAKIFLFGGSADAEACSRMEQAIQDHVVNLAGKTDLVETGSHLQEMDLVISNDSGPMHMAAAIGVPTLGIFGPTDPTRTGPCGKQHRVVMADACCCRPCFSRDCREGDAVCMSGIDAERVANIALEMLAEGRMGD